jgi:hypothetical protein
MLAWSEAGAEIAPSEDGAALVLRQAPAGSRVYMVVWQAGDDDAAFRSTLRRTGFPNPVELTRGGPLRFPHMDTRQGIINADPAAAGTAYEIDDIPIPFDNRWRTPMTLSGIAFDATGNAFVCTMVGDVWKVSGLDDRLEKVTWKRFATGLNMPMGIVVVDGVPYVSCRKQVIKLHDLNGNEEADYYEQWNRVEIPLGALNGGDIMRDAAGNFYINGGRGIVRMSPDGREVSWVGRGARNPFGLGVRGDGLVLSDSSEGESGNGTCTIYEGDHPENAASRAKLKRILYLPRGVDASPGSRLFLDDPRFGPLGQAIVGLSYGSGSWYAMLRDPGEGTPQAAMLPMPGTFWSGACRLAQHPGDGQVFVVGLDGWGDYAVAEGCVHRIRYTGAPALTPTAWQAHRNGLMVHFNEPVDAAHLDPAASSRSNGTWSIIVSPMALPNIPSKTRRCQATTAW